MKGNHRNPQPVIPVTSRKFSHNFLKVRNGNNRIQYAWRMHQIKSYGGLMKYIAMRLDKSPQPQRNELFFTLKNG